MDDCTPAATPTIAGASMSIGGAPASPPPPPIERATLHLYQLYDVSYAIDLEAARAALATPASRARPAVSRAGSISIPQLPLELSIADFDLALGGTTLHGHLPPHIYDLRILP